MTDILIRNLDEEVRPSLKEKAAADGKGLEPWLKERLTLREA